MMIHLDTSVLIDAFSGTGGTNGDLRDALEAGDRITFSTVVMYEWLRGPRSRAELDAQEALFPREATSVFGPEEAATAAELYGRVARPRGREIDLAIAACALRQDARLWTLNSGDFADIPGLELYTPGGTGFES